MRLSELPIVDRTREEEFEKWWSHTQVKFMCGETLAKQIWKNAWTCAKLGQWEATKAEVLSEIKAKLFADATSAFLDGDDDEAILLRRVANKIESCGV